MATAKTVETWAKRYTDYAAKRTDAPVEFHEAHAYVLLATAIGRKAVLRLAQGDLYSSLWIMILSDSSLYRKSTSQDIAVDLLKRAIPDVLAPNDFTPQQFVAVMAQRSGAPTLWVRDEFSGFYAALNKLDWHAGGKEALNYFYDCRPYRRELRKEKFDIPEPFLCVMTASVKDRFLELASVDDVLSGFLPRFAFVVPTELPQRRDFEPLSEAMEAERDTLLEEFKELVDREAGETIPAPGVLQRWNTYQATLEQQAAADTRASLVGPVNTRASIMALKVAMALAYADVGIVEMDHLLVGIELAERWRQTDIELLGEIGPTKWEKTAQRILELVMRKPGITRSEVMRTIKLSSREMTDFEVSLEERQQIEVRIGGKTKPGRHYYPGEKIRK